MGELLRKGHIRRHVALPYVKYLFLAVDREILLVTVAMKILLRQLCRCKVELRSGKTDSSAVLEL